MFQRKKNDSDTFKVAPMDAKITIDNLRSILNGSEYVNGIDRDTAVKLVGQLYEYLTSRHEGAISLPAPVDSPEDKYRIIWPEGCKINSRRMSTSSAGSKNDDVRDKYALSKHISSDRVVRRAMSVTSSTYSTRYVGIIDEEDEPVPHATKERPQKATLTHRERGGESRTMKINDDLMRPTPSIERFIMDDGNDSQPRPLRTSRTEAARPRTRATAQERMPVASSRFADE